MAIFSLFGLIIGMINYEYGVYVIKDVLNPEKYPDPMEDPRNNSMVSQICRIAITTTSIMACICLYFRQKFKINWSSKFMCTDNIADPNNVSFMYDELINETDECGIQRKGRVVTFGLVL